jgi:hypothetical protein
MAPVKRYRPVDEDGDLGVYRLAPIDLGRSVKRRSRKLAGIIEARAGTNCRRRDVADGVTNC